MVRRLSQVTVFSEAAVVLLLIGPAETATIGFLLSSTLLLIFTGALLIVIRRGHRRSCRCFGTSATPVGPLQVARNLVLLAMSLAGLMAIASEPTPSLDSAPLTMTIAAGAILGVLIASIDEIIEVFRV
ncbi:hypothetical protein Sme01_16970 [Sphaerisporangium melleum]|uniref:Methylamine utilisation protein MauE domain-containing protein n=2 Tax=Sphaerisporangium melleum TaxID=321316 RepID=A0A917VIL9_9ACTN|nr:hypothetical protein GCM10007964_26910 [Sphaerisporangium melleum]GII69221.1 hypothetical protein Sme01_16970 [Sphaerisporangium melleum]